MEKPEKRRWHMVFRVFGKFTNIYFSVCYLILFPVRHRETGESAAFGSGLRSNPWTPKWAFDHWRLWRHSDRLRHDRMQWPAWQGDKFSEYVPPQLYSRSRRSKHMHCRLDHAESAAGWGHRLPIRKHRSWKDPWHRWSSTERPSNERKRRVFHNENKR